MRWEFLPVVTADAAADSVVLVYRKNFFTGRLFAGSDIQSICVADRGVAFARVASEEMGDVAQSPDGRWVAYVTEPGIRIRAITGLPGPERPDKTQFGRPVWLDPDTVLTFSIGRPARTFTLSTRATSDLAVRLAPDRPAQAGLHVSQCAIDAEGRLVLYGPDGDRYA